MNLELLIVKVLWILRTCYAAKKFTTEWTCDFQTDECGVRLTSGSWERFYYKTDYNVFYQADIVGGGAFDDYQASFTISSALNSTTIGGKFAGRLSFNYTVFSTLLSDRRTYLEVQPCRSKQGGQTIRYSSQAYSKAAWNSTSVRFACSNKRNVQISFLASGGYGRSVRVRVDSISLEVRRQQTNRKLSEDSLSFVTNASVSPVQMVTRDGAVHSEIFTRPKLRGQTDTRMFRIRTLSPVVGVSVVGIVCLMLAAVYKRRKHLAEVDNTANNFHESLTSETNTLALQRSSVNAGSIYTVSTHSGYPQNKDSASLEYSLDKKSKDAADHTSHVKRKDGVEHPVSVLHVKNSNMISPHAAIEDRQNYPLITTDGSCKTRSFEYQFKETVL